MYLRTSQHQLLIKANPKNPKNPRMPSKNRDNRISGVQPLSRSKSFCLGYMNELGSRIGSKCRYAPEFCTKYDDRNHMRFEHILSSPMIDLNKLKQLAWNGIPDCCRLMTWQILSGILTIFPAQHGEILIKKRDEYNKFISTYFQNRNSTSNSATIRQICIDIPRTFPLVPIFQNDSIQSMYQRILYIWAIRHPASSYVQGINDLIGPILFSALFPYFGSDVLTSDPSTLDGQTLLDVEVNCFWLLTKLLDNIIDNYTPDQPGIQTKIRKVRRLVEMFDSNQF
ncbi:TBC1 domain family member 22B [Thelohanellus kitauei]|uniref:TBC1 domain family member 22B n=1 Tax=Thelohanellus kitauei TaxID=669202 RepID=A0A0C2MW21_THEKT|nr:TBC1 domain family member 22B [Thelohanellus kitauei]